MSAGFLNTSALAGIDQVRSEAAEIKAQVEEITPVVVALANKGRALRLRMSAIEDDALALTAEQLGADDLGQVERWTQFGSAAEVAAMAAKAGVKARHGRRWALVDLMAATGEVPVLKRFGGR